MKQKDKHKRLPLVKVICVILAPIVNLLFRIKVEGIEKLPKSGGYVFCSNHLSFLDPVFWIVKTKKQINYMAKEELFKNSFLSWLFRKIGAFPVARGKGDLTSVHNATDLVNDGKILGIFPEGTRSKDGKPGRAKSGAAYIANLTGADIVPMAIVVKGKVRPFCKVKLIIGDVIKHEEIAFSGTDRKALKSATDRIMGDIITLWESGQNEQ